MSLFYIVFSVMIIYRNTKLLHTYDKDEVILHTSEERLGVFGGCMFDRTHISLFLVIDAINNDAEFNLVLHSHLFRAIRRLKQNGGEMKIRTVIHAYFHRITSLLIFASSF